MNSRQLHIWKAQRTARYRRDLQSLQIDFANRGLTSSGLRNQAERDLRLEMEAEVEAQEIQSAEDERVKNREYSKDALLIAAAILSPLISIYALMNTLKTDEITNRPYLSVDPTKLESLKTGHARSDLNNTSNLLLEKKVEFDIKNVGKSPASYKVDVTELLEPGLQKATSLQNTEGIIFPEEQKTVSFLLEISQTSPQTTKEAAQWKEYLDRVQAFQLGDVKNIARIRVEYEQLGESEKLYRTIIDEIQVKTFFAATPDGRMDGFSDTWIISDDSR